MGGFSQFWQISWNSCEVGRLETAWWSLWEGGGGRLFFSSRRFLDLSCNIYKELWFQLWLPPRDKCCILKFLDCWFSQPSSFSVSFRTNITLKFYIDITLAGLVFNLRDRWCAFYGYISSSISNLPYPSNSHSYKNVYLAFKSRVFNCSEIIWHFFRKQFSQKLPEQSWWSSDASRIYKNVDCTASFVYMFFTKIFGLKY